MYVYYGIEGEEASAPNTQAWNDVEIEVLNGKLYKVSYKTSVNDDTSGTGTEYRVVHTFSNYGTTSIDNNTITVQRALTETEWNAMLRTSNLTNYTLNYESKYISKNLTNEALTSVHNKISVKFTANKIADRAMDLLESDAKWSDWRVFHTNESEKYAHEWIFMALLDGKFNNWAYDSVTGAYYAPNGIITSTNVETHILFELNNGELKISNGKLSEATFYMTIADIDHGETVEGVFIFKFSDYGTTVITEDITPYPAA